jgi:hypothetical protein
MPVHQKHAAVKSDYAIIDHPVLESITDDLYESIKLIVEGNFKGIDLIKKSIKKLKRMS